MAQRRRYDGMRRSPATTAGFPAPAGPDPFPRRTRRDGDDCDLNEGPATAQDLPARQVYPGHGIRHEDERANHVAHRHGRADPHHRRLRGLVFRTHGVERIASRDDRARSPMRIQGSQAVAEWQAQRSRVCGTRAEHMGAQQSRAPVRSGTGNRCSRPAALRPPRAAMARRRHQPRTLVSRTGPVAQVHRSGTGPRSGVWRSDTLAGRRTPIHAAHAHAPRFRHPRPRY